MLQQKADKSNHVNRLILVLSGLIETGLVFGVNYGLHALSLTIPTPRPCYYSNDRVFTMRLNGWQKMNSLGKELTCANNDDLEKNFWSNHSGSTAIAAYAIGTFVVAVSVLLKQRHATFLNENHRNLMVDLIKASLLLLALFSTAGTASARVTGNCHSFSAVMIGIIQGFIQAALVRETSPLIVSGLSFFTKKVDHNTARSRFNGEELMEAQDSYRHESDRVQPGVV